MPTANKVRLVSKPSISGTLSEIAAFWRRAEPYLPRLPLLLPVQLQQAAR